MSAHRFSFVLAFIIATLLSGCGEPAREFPPPRDPLPDPEIPADAESGARIVHAVTPFALQGSQETMNCYSWTVDNDAPLYVQAADFQNAGSFHHSNWFVVPEDVYPGDDGFWPCAERDFEDVSATLAGTVLFAQSTQAQQESMAFVDGATIRIPARSKIVAGIHMLNLSPDPRETAAWLSLDVIHPALVESVLSPVVLSYFDLNIPPKSRASFHASCISRDILEIDDFELHYILPHYHRAGTSAKVTLFEHASPMVVLDHEGFGASPMGRTLEPPAAFESLGRIEFSCGYENPHDEALTWGIGINEMCTFLGFANTSHVLIAAVEPEGTLGMSEDDNGTFVANADCQSVAIPRSNAYDLPTRAEISGLLVLPNTDGPAPRPPSCEDVEAVVDDTSTPTFSEIQARVLQPSCTFSSCHGEAGAGGLVLDGDAAFDALVGAASTAVDMPRVAPGDPDGSYLIRLLSACAPEVQGVSARHMPLGAPTLLDPELVSLVHTWVETGAAP